MSFGYEILGELGRGCMGVVHRARQRGLEREVALKMVALAPGVRASPSFLARLEREGLALAKLSHPNLVKVLDAGQHDGFPYVAMELVSGRTLEQLVREDPVSVRRRSGELFAQLVGAVAELHRNGLVHRDLKPANVMVDAKWRAVVMDLGLVRDTSGDGVCLTDTGALIGTPLYLAPEIFSGAIADARADVWSLGCIWFYLHTGRAPFAGETFADLIRAIVAGALPDFARELPDMPPEQCGLLARMLTRAPDERPRDAARVLALLEGRRGSGASARPGRAPRAASGDLPVVPSARRARPRALAAGGRALAAAALVAGFVATRERPADPAPGPPSRAPVPVVASPSPAPPSYGAEAEGAALKSLLARVRELRGFSARVKAGGPTAESAQRDLFKRTGIALPRQAWQFWFELDEWLASPRGTPRPLAPSLSDSLVAEEFTFSAFESTIGGRRFNAVDHLSTVLDVLTQHPRECRGWLHLGLIYQLGGSPEPARRLYRVGLGRLSASKRLWSGRSYEAVAHAMHRTGRLLEDWRAFAQHGELMERREAWMGLLSALADDEPELCERLLRAADPRDEVIPVSLKTLFTYQERPHAEHVALFTELVTRTRDPVFKRELVDLHLSVGDLDAGIPPFLELESVDGLRSLLESPSGPTTAPVGPSVRSIRVHARRRAELRDLEGLRVLFNSQSAAFDGPIWAQFGAVALGLGEEWKPLRGQCNGILLTRLPPHTDRAEFWSGIMWPGPTPADRARQRAFLARLVADHPDAAELVVAQALFAAREGQHDSALDLLERALAHPAAERFGRWSVLEVLVRPLLLAADSPAAPRARTLGLPPARRRTAHARLIDDLWGRLAAGDRAGAASVAQKAFRESPAVAPGLIPLWIHPKDWPERAAWQRRVRAAWRWSSVNAFAPEL